MEDQVQSNQGNMGNTQPKSNPKCCFCDVEFSTVSAKNKHIRNMHNQQTTDNKTLHVICPLCIEQEFICGSYNKLQIHLEASHQVKVEVLTFHFSSHENYEQWLREQKIEGNYAMCRTRRHADHIEKNYICSRSNSTGYKSNYHMRTEKAGGSIKMYGVCPSRVITKLYETGQTIVKFWKSHVGHESIERPVSDSCHNKNIARAHKMAEIEDKADVNEVGFGEFQLKSSKGNVSDSSCEQQPSNVKEENNEECDHNIKEERNEDQCTASMSTSSRREHEIQSVANFLSSLDDDTYHKCMSQFVAIMDQVNKSSTGKRKMAKQDYFSSHRKK